MTDPAYETELTRLARLAYIDACERVGWQGDKRKLPQWEALPERERRQYIDTYYIASIMQRAMKEAGYG